MIRTIAEATPRTKGPLAGVKFKAKDVSQLAKEAPKGGKLLQCFFHVDLRCAHDGLSEVAKKQGIDVQKLAPGNYVVFINHAKDRLKLFAAHNVVAYLKLPKGQKLDLKVLRLIPEAFQASGRINYDEALREVLTKELTRKSV